MNDRAAKTGKSPFPAALLDNPLLHAALIVVLGLLAYANTFQVPFVFDDFQSLLELPYVQDLRYFTDWSLAREFAGDYNFRMRFVTNLTFALNHALHGVDVAGYHIVNLAIHLANALLVYLLVRLTLRTPFFGNVECGMLNAECEIQNSTFIIQPSSFIPLFAALLFVAHPVQTQAVTYIVQRLTSLATLFCLATVVLYIVARLALNEEGWKGRAILCYGAALCCALLAMKTKEIAFTLPIAVCVYEFMFLRGNWKRRLVCLVPLLLTMLVIPLTLLMPAGTGGALGDVGSVTRVDSDLSRYEYLCTELRVIVTYLRLLVMPVNQNLIYDYPEYHTLFTPPVFLSLLLLAALFGLAVYLTYRSRFEVRGSRFEVRGSRFEVRGSRSEVRGSRFEVRGSRFEVQGSRSEVQGSPLEIQNSKFKIHNSPYYRLISFGIFWFFLTLSVESSVIPIMDVIFEHRLYLPSVGAFIALAAGWALAGEKLGTRMKGGKAAASALAGLLVLALAGATSARNGVWRSQESLWQDVVNKSPGKAAGHQNLGIALFQKGEPDKAFASFDRAIAIDPEFAEALCNRGNLYAQAGQPGKAIRDYESALAVHPEFVEAWNNLGLVWSMMGDQDKAISHLARAIALKPVYVKSLNNMGLALTRKGEPRQAIAYLDKALALNRNYGLAWFNRGVAWKETGRLDRAIADLNRAIELNPRLAAAYSQRGEALARTGARERALDDFRTACENGDEKGCNELRALTPYHPSPLLPEVGASKRNRRGILGPPP